MSTQAMAGQTLGVAETGRGATIGAVFLTLFALPFVGIGVFAATELVRGLAGGATASDMTPLVATAFMLAFGGAGTGIIWAVWHGAASAKKEAVARAAHPSEPWLWRDDWAALQVRSSQRAGALFLGYFALLWNAISLPALTAIPRELEQGNDAALVGLLFPIVGVAFAIWAMRRYIRSRKYRGTHVRLGAVPVRPGSLFEAALITHFGHGPPERVALRLTCVHRRVTRRGKNRTVTENVVWEDERELSGDDVSHDFGEARVPVSFEIPAAAIPSTPGTGNDRILWRLDAKAETVGVDYAESFELPVFGDAVRSDAPTRHALEEFATAMALGPDGTAPPPDEPVIEIRAADPEGTEFISAPGRGRAPAWPLMIFMLVWCALTGFMAVQGAPVFFTAIFGLFAVVMLLGVLDLAFTTTRTVISASGVTIETSTLGRRRARNIPRADITHIRVKTGTTSQSSAAQAARAWHDVLIRHTNGQARAARHIPTRAEAEWVAAEMRRLAGLREPAA